MKFFALTITGPDGNPIQIGPQSNSPVPTGGANFLFTVIGYGVELLFIFAIVFCLITLVFSGFSWLMSSGDKQKLQQQRQRIGFALVGLVVVFLSFFIINLVGTFLNIDLLPIPTTPQKTCESKGGFCDDRSDRRCMKRTTASDCGSQVCCAA